MPIYDYKCSGCGTTSEMLVHGINGHEISCPQCGSKEMERLLSKSLSFRMGSQTPGTTCCGRTERCGSAESPGGQSCCGG